jgi:folate-binding protein YgfZ
MQPTHTFDGATRLTHWGVIRAHGEDAAQFLHNQLSQDVQTLDAAHARLGAFCTAKGRMLASMLILRPAADEVWLLCSADVLPATLKRLSMFVLRSKVQIADVTGAWQQLGVWGEHFPGELFTIETEGNLLQVKFDEQRALLIGLDSELRHFDAKAGEEAWTLDEIRSERPFITAATQDQFVPQMVNLEKLGGVDFQKGCYPGQEIVARAQYRGAVKRRMLRLPAPEGAKLQPGQDFNGGVVVDSAGGEVLAVVPI